MARTTSATQRQSFALAVALASGHRALVNRLILLGNGDFVRGIAIALAIFLTTAGMAVPHLPDVALMAFLFLSGAALALLGICQPLIDAQRATQTFENVKRTDNTPASTSALSLPRTISELLSFAETRTSRIGLASWAHLTNCMSHELRTPLNAVLGFSELMTHEAFGPLGSERYAEYARDIHASGRTLLKSSEDALAITSLLTSQDRKGRNASVLAAGPIASATEFLACETASRGVSIQVSADATLEVMADGTTLRQIMINLLFEACDRAADGAAITVETSADGSDAYVLISISEERNSARLREESFSMLLARTLVELSGAELEERVQAEGWWRPSVRFTRASQPDFFSTLTH